MRDAANPKTAKPLLQRKPKPRKVDTKPPRDEEAGMRIAKVMARAGLCSRRDAETWIEQGRVTLNGKVLTSPAINIGPEDKVSVDGTPLAARERTRLFLFHKPRGLVTTDKDPEGRKTIFDHLQATWPDGPRVIAVGRLDINTEGLLLLTNDGGLARVLELPSTGWMRRYRVRANGKTDQSILDRLRGGVSVDGIDYAGIEATLDRVQGDNVWLTLALREGKNREIKRVLEHINLFVNRLIRISFGPFQLGDLAEGTVEEVRTRVLRDQLGPGLAQEADADFDSPLAEVHSEPALPQRARGRNDAKSKERGSRGKKEPRENGRDRKPPARPRGDRPETGRNRKPSSAARGRNAEREAPAPLEPSFKPRGPRKHISAMRNTGAAKAEPNERKRTLLSETADRKGRTVVVERKAKAAPRKPREEAPVGPKGAAKKPAFKRVNAKNAKAPAPRTSRPAKPGRPQRPR
jgi:23S rRNA pseudouridine2605 synthase